MIMSAFWDIDVCAPEGLITFKGSKEKKIQLCKD